MHNERLTSTVVSRRTCFRWEDIFCGGTFGGDGWTGSGLGDEIAQATKRPRCDFG
jgi:hypothetical protein